MGMTAEEHQTFQLPVIDISSPSQQVADDIVSAAATYGFVFVKSSGLDVTPFSVIKTFEAAKQFFASPASEKETCPMQLDNKGWTSMNEEILDPATDKKGDPKEAFNFGEFENGKATQPLPPSFRNYEAHLADFYSQCRRLCMRILKLFALGLKIDTAEGGEEWISSRHDSAQGPSGTILRLLHYPPSSRSSSPSLRAGAHSDYGSLTLLFRLPNQPGLEILTPSGRWSPVPVSPPSTEEDEMPPVLVNIGDLLSFWTGGLLKSTVHRVVFEESRDAAERYSIAFFCHPARDTELVSVPSAMVKAWIEEKGDEDKVGYGAMGYGRAVTAQEHLQGRLAATYGWGKVKDDVAAS